MKASICIAAFNKPLLLKLTLNSIFAQKGDYEVIVVDDGSKDAEISKVCKDYDVILHRIDRPPIFRNPCVSRNAAYRLATGDVIIAQSDEVVHVSDDVIATLSQELEEHTNTFVIATVFNREKDGKVISQFTGHKRQKPFFFLGALWRKDLYAVGGNDEDFANVRGYEDAWFADNLMLGLGLSPYYTDKVVGHHLWHPNYNLDIDETPAKQLYEKKHREGMFRRPWPFIERAQTTEDIFTGIFKTIHWGEGESVSGSGSSLEATKKLRQELPVVLKKLGVTSLLDLPCGDYNWMRETVLPCTYIGGDIVKPIIERNRTKYPGVQFEHLDLLTSDLPRVDAIFCRDCLGHFSQEDVRKAIANIKRAGIKYLLTTTFPKHTENRNIPTGEWTTINLQTAPYNFGPPIYLINEDCQELYPHFNDKSIGVWSLSDTKSITVCVDFADLLAITLPRNRKHFKHTLVVTAPHDTQTQELCKELNVEYMVTNAFYRHGAHFNKGAAMEEGFDKLGRDGWICIWDCDIVMPDSIEVPDKKVGNLYNPIRMMLEDIEDYPKYADEKTWTQLSSPTRPNEFDGYFQLFHADSPLKRPWYSATWIHAGGCDSDFQEQFASKNKIRLPFKVLHLGPEGIPELKTRLGRNWCGRGKQQLMEKIVKDRNVYGTIKERIVNKGISIPREMNFFWTGRMSWLRYLTLQSFVKFNPDFKTRLHLYIGPRVAKTWRTDETDDFQYEGKDYLEELHKLPIEVVDHKPTVCNLPPAQMSDVFQWRTLSTSGGYYADMDILWLKPLDSIEEEVADADVLFCHEEDMIAIGFFGAKPRLPLFQKLYTECTVRAQHGRSYQYFGSYLVTDLFYSPKKRNANIAHTCIENIQERYPELRIGVLPDEIIYPFVWKYITNIFRTKQAIPEKSVGMHWFAGSPVSQYWAKTLAPNTWQKYNNTFTEALKRVL